MHRLLWLILLLLTRWLDNLVDMGIRSRWPNYLCCYWTWDRPCITFLSFHFDGSVHHCRWLWWLLFQVKLRWSSLHPCWKLKCSGRYLQSQWSWLGYDNRSIFYWLSWLLNWKCIHRIYSWHNRCNYCYWIFRLCKLLYRHFKWYSSHLQDVATQLGIRRWWKLLYLRWISSSWTWWIWYYCWIHGHFL